jgi:3-oxoacyl-[acyl-carrier-protein] synthase II
MRRRAVITGLGVISPVGNNVKDFWNNIVSGVSGIDWVKAFESDGYPSRVAGEVKDFDPTTYMDRKEARRTSRFIQFAVASSGDAVADSRLSEELLRSEKVAVIFGVGMGGMDFLEAQHCVLLEKGPQRVSPFMIPMSIPNMAAGTLAVKYGCRGKNLTIVTACAASTNAMGEAMKMIRNGEADIVISGGSESTITPLSFAGFGSMTALSKSPPEKASRPFDKNRDGFVIAEGSATFIIEELEHAQKRNAPIYAEILGYGTSDDASHITAPDTNGRGAIASMRSALEDAEIEAGMVDYINAHGTSTPLNDAVETRAIKAVFGKETLPSISSTKSMHGHALGAAGAIEAAATILAMKNGWIPPTINYETPDPECDLDYTPNKAIKKNIDYALSNSFGFGGHNATLIFRDFTE